MRSLDAPPIRLVTTAPLRPAFDYRELGLDSGIEPERAPPSAQAAAARRAEDPLPAVSRPSPRALDMGQLAQLEGKRDGVAYVYGMDGMYKVVAKTTGRGKRRKTHYEIYEADFGAGYDRIGPRFFPYVVAAGSLFSGALLLKEALRRGQAPKREPASRTSRSVGLTLCLALASSVLLLERAGFVLTAALLFWLVARAFASPRPLLDAAVGLALSAAAYFAFTRGLGMVLPGGLLGGLL